MKRTNSFDMIRTGLIASAALGCALTLNGCVSRYEQATEKGRPNSDEIVTYGYYGQEEESFHRTTTLTDVPVARTEMPARSATVGTVGTTAGVIKLDQVVPPQVIAGKDFNGELRVTNLTDAKLEGVVVTSKPANGLRVTSTTPEAESSGGAMTWNVGDLGPHETKTYKYVARSDVAGPITNCAAVTYTPGASACSTIQVTKTELVLSSDVAERYSKCDTIPYKVTVKNTGVGPANNVVIRQELPEGLVGADGRRTVDQNIGTLAQGESRTVTLNLKAEHGGTYNLATNMEGATAPVKSTITVGEPVLQVKVNAPQRDYINADIPCEITVTNTGDYPAMNTTLQFSSDARGAMITAADTGKASTGVANQWSLGTIEPKQSRTVKANIKSSSPGTVRAAFTANAQCAKQTSATAETELRGIPALLLEVVDQVDPVRIGQDTVYTITVTNQGSEVATNIKIDCTLEEAVSMTSAQGATTSDAKPGASKVNFAPLAKLAPGEKAVWRITVKGQKPADTRFGVTMTSAELQRNVEETESTHVYGDTP